MNKHTPGPWHLTIDFKYIMAPMTSGGYSIARMDDLEAPYDTRFANAYLIAAAPAMLAALELAEEAYRIGITDVPEEMWERVNDLRAQAIVMARGEGA